MGSGGEHLRCVPRQPPGADDGHQPHRVHRPTVPGLGPHRQLQRRHPLVHQDGHGDHREPVAVGAVRGECPSELRNDRSEARMTIIFTPDGKTVTRRFRTAPAEHWEQTSETGGRYVPADTSTGYFPLVEAARPTDTDTHTHDLSIVRTGDTFIETWTARPWTTEEQESKTEQSNSAAIRNAAAQAIQGNRDFLAIQAPANPQLAAQIRKLTQQNQALIRLALSQFESTD